MIKFLVMDVDGTLTDGKIYMGQDGESVKAFNIKDGAGIVLLLPKQGIIPVIITARESKILENRCKELHITELHQGSKDKLKTLDTILAKYGAGLDAVAYVGDDLPDIPCMEAVKNAGGLVLSPADAIPEILGLADFITSSRAGEGAVRDCIHYLMTRQQTRAKGLEQCIQETLSLILKEDYSQKGAGMYTLPNGMQYTIQEYMTKDAADCVLETHREHIDIQYIISGKELFQMYSTNCLIEAGKYDPVKDVQFWNGGLETTTSILVPGGVIIVSQNQPHKGAIRIAEPEMVRKVVCKIPSAH